MEIENTEVLQRIVHELSFGSRKSKVKLIQELASDEFETPQAVFELAQKNKKQINAQLSSLFDYYSDELKPKFNTNFPEENKIKRELSENGLLGYKLFLEDLTDGNYHELRNKITELLIVEIEKRNKKKV